MAGQPPDPYDYLAPVPSFAVTSNDIQDGGTLAAPQLSGIFGVAGGTDTSPHLAWSGFPEGTRGFAVTCLDPDAPTGSGFWHWAVYGIPGNVTEDGAGLPAGSVQLRHDGGIRQFLGAAPPPGHGAHRYYFVVHALDTDQLEMASPEASPALLCFLMSGHTLARGTLLATYGR
jgi:Raf kinase inhibitor-like YbhB/YbcL family protein